MELQTAQTAPKTSNVFLFPNETTKQFYTNNDVLTGLLNRKGFMEELSAHKDAELSGNGVLLLFDIDALKRTNIAHGRHIGDAILKLVAETLDFQKRDTDILGRLHKDKFALALTNTSFNKALEMTIRFNKILNRLKLSSQGETIDVTVFISTVPYVSETSTSELMSVAARLLENQKSRKEIPAYLGND